MGTDDPKVYEGTELMAELYRWAIRISNGTQFSKVENDDVVPVPTDKVVYFVTVRPELIQHVEFRFRGIRHRLNVTRFDARRKFRRAGDRLVRFKEICKSAFCKFFVHRGTAEEPGVPSEPTYTQPEGSLLPDKASGFTPAAGVTVTAASDKFTLVNSVNDR